MDGTKTVMGLGFFHECGIEDVGPIVHSRRLSLSWTDRIVERGGQYQCFRYGPSLTDKSVVPERAAGTKKVMAVHKCRMTSSSRPSSESVWPDGGELVSQLRWIDFILLVVLVSISHRIVTGRESYFVGKINLKCLVPVFAFVFHRHLGPTVMYLTF